MRKTRAFSGRLRRGSASGSSAICRRTRDFGNWARERDFLREKFSRADIAFSRRILRRKWSFAGGARVRKRTGRFTTAGNCRRAWRIGFIRRACCNGCRSRKKRCACFAKRCVRAEKCCTDFLSNRRCGNFVRSSSRAFCRWLGVRRSNGWSFFGRRDFAFCARNGETNAAFIATRKIFCESYVIRERRHRRREFPPAHCVGFCANMNGVSATMPPAAFSQPGDFLESNSVRSANRHRPLRGIYEFPLIFTNFTTGTLFSSKREPLSIKHKALI